MLNNDLARVALSGVANQVENVEGLRVDDSTLDQGFIRVEWTEDGIDGYVWITGDMTFVIAPEPPTSEDNILIDIAGSDVHDVARDIAETLEGVAA
jgi:hypothetical protein